MAAGYGQWYGTSSGMAHDLAQKSDVLCFVSPAENGARLLDVGCGTGHWSRFFTALGYRVTGVDVSPHMLEAARTQPEARERYLLADACALPFPSGAFDIVSAIAALEFMTGISAALRELFRCIRPGGQAIIGTLNRHAPMNQRRLAKGGEPYASAHLLSGEELRRLLAPFGVPRLRASEPERRFLEEGLSEHCANGDAAASSGPLLVAEVRR